MDNNTHIASDHDMLVTLIANQSNNHANTIEKIGQLQDKVEEVKDTTNVKFAAHEVRISAIEKAHERVNTDQLALKVESQEKWINDFQITWKTTLRNVVVTSSITAFLLGIIVTIITIIQRFSGGN